MDHLADIKKFAKKPVNEAAAAGLIKAYQLVMSKPDTRFVACTDPAELERVKTNFCEKKLGVKGRGCRGRDQGDLRAHEIRQDQGPTTFYYCLPSIMESSICL